MTTPNTEPAFDELADEDDQLGWDREKHGKMLEQTAPAPLTVPWEDEDGVSDSPS